MSRTDFNTLLEAGAHFGHLKRKWNPKMAPYIFMEKNGIHIIDLHKTVIKIDEAAAAIKQIAKSGRRVLFVATKKQAKDIVAEKVAAIGMPYVTERWAGGMLTNFPTIRKAVKKMATIDKMTADGVDYAPVNDGGNSTFVIPVTLDEDIAVSAETVAMSTPHTIDYTLYFDSSTMKEKSGDDASGGSPAGTASSAAADFHTADLGCGWEPTGALQLEYAEHFTVDEFEGGLRLICVSNGERFLVVPQDAKVPDGLSSDIAVIRRPADKVYLVSSATMCLVDALDANDNIFMSGTKADDCSVAGFKSALESGAIAYGGKYSAPDYERISASGCTLAIENAMINHTPDVKEKLQKLGLVVLTEQSSSEPEALGRVEWIKLFGVLFDKEDEAAHLFNEQKARVEQTSGLASSGKTVAYFYINSNGAAVTRRAGDYVAQMIELAGGSYALDDAQTASTSGSSVTLEMERFYATAKDADIIVYNGTIDESVATLNDFVGKNALLSQFKAVRNGNVWVTSADMYQQMTSTADIIDELHGAFTGDDASDFHYLRKLG